MIGMAIAVFYTKINHNNHIYQKLKQYDYLPIILGISGIIACIYYYELSGGKQHYYEGHISLFCFDTALATSIGILIMTLSFQGKIGTMLFANKPMIFLGTISYGIYLWHALAFQLLIDKFPLMTQVNFIQEGMIGIFVTIFVASLSYYFVEKPCINLAKKYSKNLIKK